MLFRSIVLLAAVMTGEAAMEGSIRADSRIGKNLLSKASPVEGDAGTPRKLENADQDNTWIAGFSIKYLSCSSLVQIASEEGGGGGEEGRQLYNQNLVKFALCPSSSSCSSCDGSDASYVVNMADFVQAWAQMKEEELQQQCEMVANYCYCDNANDDQVCEAQCYTDAGLEDCIEVEGQEQVEVERFMECAEFDGGGDNNNGNYNYNNGNNNDVNRYQQYFAGAYCDSSDGKSIHLGLFLDGGCTTLAKTGTFKALTYGQELPYETTPMITSECVSCLQVDQDANDNQNNNNGNNNNNNQNNNNNNNQNYEVIELCQQSYEMAAKCEEGLNTGSNYFYPDTNGCYYINSILPKLEKASRNIGVGGAGGAGGAATAFAVIFALTTVVLGLYAFFLYRKIHRAKVNLAQSEGGALA